jgi:hypothetical protein
MDAFLKDLIRNREMNEDLWKILDEISDGGGLENIRDVEYSLGYESGAEAGAES